MSIGERIYKYRIASGKTQDEVANALNTTPQNIYKYEKGIITNIPLSNIQRMADLFNVRPSVLVGWEDEGSEPTDSWVEILTRVSYMSSEQAESIGKQILDILTQNAPTIFSLSSSETISLKKYRALDSHGKRMVDFMIDEETARMQAEQAKPTKTEKPATKIIPLFGNSFAAGPGEPDLGNMWDDYEVPVESHAEFAIRINGDSMEPYLHDGSIALGRKEMPRDGDVAAILLDGTFICKQVCQDAFGNLYLFSLNRDRSDMDVTIRHDSERSVSCFGTIIMNKRIPLPII